MKTGIMQGRLSPPTNNRIQSFPWNSWKDEFKIAKNNNINLIEWTIDSFKINKNPIFTQPDKIKKISKKNNVLIKSVTCDFLMEDPFYKNFNNKINSIYYLEKLFKVSKKIGIKFVIFPLVDNGRLTKKSELRKLISNLKLIDNYLGTNLKILFESDFAPTKLLNFIRKFNPKKYGINYDTGNSASLGYNIDLEFKAYSKYIENIHIKDRKFKSKTVKLGSGDYDFIKFFKNINKTKYKGNLILQTARGKKYKEINLLKYNISFINKHLKNKNEFKP